MNAGAYGGEIAHILQSCQDFDYKDGEIETLSAKDLAFGYRHSAIQSGAVVLSAKFALSSRNIEVIKQENGPLDPSTWTQTTFRVSILWFGL